MTTKRRLSAVGVPPARSVSQLKVTLREIRPPIWRRVLVPDNFTLGQLHEVIQTAMGWKHSHMHAFRLPARGFGPPRREFGAGPDMEDENAVFLGGVLVRQRQVLVYEYDFGDGWEHQIVLEKTLPIEPQAQYPLCLAGARACPPEDCGGYGGYYDLMRMLHAAEKTEEQKELLEWLGEDYNPEAFDLDAVNRRFGH